MSNLKGDNVPQGGFPPYTSHLMLQSFFLGIIPPLFLVASIVLRDMTLLTYAHIMPAVMWTGFDLFMAIIMGRILGSLDITGRVEVAKRLTPSTFFIMPSLAATTITAGIYLAQFLGVFNLANYWIIATLIILAILTAQGFGIFMPNSMRIFIELAKQNPDREKIARLNGINIRLAGVQGVFQIAIIFVMVNITNLTSGPPALDLPTIFYSLLVFAAMFLAIYGLIYRSAYLSYKRGELDKKGIDTLKFGLLGHIIIFILLGLTLLFA
jgi:hypothetical protein